MVYFFIFTTILLLISSILLLRAAFRLQDQNRQLVEMIQTYDNQQTETKEKLEELFQQLKDTDLNGSFEADDEVGFVFQEIKNLIEEYKNNIQ